MRNLCTTSLRTRPRQRVPSAIPHLPLSDIRHRNPSLSPPGATPLLPPRSPLPKTTRVRPFCPALLTHPLSSMTSSRPTESATQPDMRHKAERGCDRGAAAAVLAPGLGRPRSSDSTLLSPPDRSSGTDYQLEQQDDPDCVDFEGSSTGGCKCEAKATVGV